MYDTIISTTALAKNLDNKAYILLDCRSDLANPGWGSRDYEEKHIKGAIYVDLLNDLSSPITPSSGRHPLPVPEIFIQKVSQWGIEPQKQVVAIDTSNGTYAGRIWWLLRAIGHSQVAVLDGGMGKWLDEKRPVEHGIVTNQPTTYRYPTRYDHQRMISTQALEGLLHQPDYRFLDSRAPERFRGEIEPIDQIAGRIPGAVNRWVNANLQPDGTLKPAHILQAELANLLQGVTADHIIAYCGSGVTACHNLLALEVAGFQGAILYPGSWSEWIRNPSHPIEKG